MLADHTLTAFDGVAHQIRCFGKGAALKATRRSDQFGGRHVLPKRVLSGTPYLAFDGDGWWIHLREIAVNDEAVLGFKPKVVFIVARQGPLQVDAQHDEFIVAGPTEYLHGIGGGVGGQAAGEVYGIAHASGAVGQMIARIPYLARNRDDRRVFKIEAREDSHRIEGFQPKRRLFRT